jgi:hypothetical protein
MLVLAEEEFYLSVKHHINDSSLIPPTVCSIWTYDRLSIHNKYLKVLDGEDKR